MNDWLAHHIKRSVEDERNPRYFMEHFEQGIKSLVIFWPNGLNPSGPVFVYGTGNLLDDRMKADRGVRRSTDRRSEARISGGYLPARLLQQRKPRW